MGVKLMPFDDILVFKNPRKIRGANWKTTLVPLNCSLDGNTNNVHEELMVFCADNEGNHEAKTLIQGTITDFEGAGCRRTYKIFKGRNFSDNSEVVCAESNFDGTFSAEVYGYNRDEFTIIALGEHNEDAPMVTKVLGKPVNG